MTERKEMSEQIRCWAWIRGLCCRPQIPRLDLLLISLVFILLQPIGHSSEKKPSREDAQFTIYIAGKEVGREKYSIQDSGDSISSTSVVTYRDPGNQQQNVRVETQLNMDAQYLPRSYQLKTDVGGQKGAVAGTFTPGQAIFEYQGKGNPRKSGLLVGDRYLILDTNVFHHYIFLVRRFEFGANKPQSIEVIIPQELDQGIIKINEIGSDKISVQGKRRELHHLRADSGQLQIDLWIDDQKVLYKIALPAKGIEVIRNP